MGQPDRGVGRVDRLPARAARAVDVDADVLVGDLDLVGLLEERHDLDRGEAGLAAALVVERADPDQPVGAGLDGQRAVGVRRVDGERGRLEPGLFGVGRVEDLDRVLVLLGPADVHPHQHLGEVGGVDAAGPGTDGQQGVADVVLTGEQRADLERLDELVEPRELVLGLGQRLGVALLLRHLDHQAEVVEAAAEAGEAVELTLEEREPAGHAGGVGLVVPQVGSGDLLPEIGDLGAHRVQVEHLLDGVHRRLELLDLGVDVGACHKAKATGRARGCRNHLTARPHPLCTIGVAGSWSGRHRVNDPFVPVTRAIDVASVNSSTGGVS